MWKGVKPLFTKCKPYRVRGYGEGSLGVGVSAGGKYYQWEGVGAVRMGAAA